MQIILVLAIQNSLHLELSSKMVYECILATQLCTNIPQNMSGTCKLHCNHVYHVPFAYLTATLLKLWNQMASLQRVVISARVQELIALHNVDHGKTDFWQYLYSVLIMRAKYYSSPSKHVEADCSTNGLAD